MYARGVPATEDKPASCPLFEAPVPGAAALPVHQLVENTNGLVWMRCYLWGLDSLGGTEGAPNLQVSPVGKTKEFVLNHAIFQMP